MLKMATAHKGTGVTSLFEKIVFEKSITQTAQIVMAMILAKNTVE
jgi:hypothetical protein